jgi:hypothetical protein
VPDEDDPLGQPARAVRVVLPRHLAEPALAAGRVAGVAAFSSFLCFWFLSRGGDGVARCRVV